MTTPIASQQTTTTQHTDRTPFLRNLLRANAAFSLTTGSLAALVAPGIAQTMGLADTTLFGFLNGTLFLQVLGVGVIIFGLAVLTVSLQPTIDRRLAWAITAADWAWVALSALILLAQPLPLTSAGGWIVLLVADCVLVLGLLEFVAVRRLGQTANA